MHCWTHSRHRRPPKITRQAPVMILNQNIIMHRPCLLMAAASILPLSVTRGRTVVSEESSSSSKKQSLVLLPGPSLGRHFGLLLLKTRRRAMHDGGRCLCASCYWLLLVIRLLSSRRWLVGGGGAKE